MQDEQEKIERQLAFTPTGTRAHGVLLQRFAKIQRESLPAQIITLRDDLNKLLEIIAYDPDLSRQSTIYQRLKENHILQVHAEIRSALEFR